MLIYIGMKNIKYITYAVFIALGAVMLTYPSAEAKAYINSYYYEMPHLYLPGIDGYTYPEYTAPKPVHLNFDVFGNSTTTTTTANGQATSTTKTTPGIFGNLYATSGNALAKDINGDPISLVSPDNTTVYAIMGGKKHFIPTVDALSSYGYKPELVKPISQFELNKYPRVSLIKMKGDSKSIYYLTEGGMVRLMPEKKVMDSYGVRAEDAVTLSKIEFNFYPKNQYVYLESPLNRDVFQIVEGKGKRYMTPMAVQRLGITSEQVAPINQTEYNSYKVLAPVVN